MSDHLPPAEQWARFRFSIIGALLACPPEAGQLRHRLVQLAGQLWRHPLDGTPMRLSVATLERWFYAARGAQDPVAALRPRRRRDAGCSRLLSVVLTDKLHEQHQAHPSWSMRLHHDNLRAWAASQQGLAVPSYSTLVRYMKARGLRKRRRPRPGPGAQAAAERLAQREVRSCETEFVHALWHADCHQGSRKVLLPGGRWIVPQLFGVLDDRSRLACHLQWYHSECAETFVHGLSRAPRKRAAPRALMTDNGSAMLAGEVREGLARLGVVHETTLPHSP